MSNTRAQLAKSPRPDESAERLALRGTDDLVATDERYERIATHLGAIRASTKTLVAPTVFPRFATRTLMLTMSTEARLAIGAGTYHGWDCINEWYGVVSHSLLDGQRIVIVNFRGLYHPQRVAAAYRAHPDVHRAEPSVALGDGPDIAVYPIGNGTHRYVFRGAGQDCLSGCIDPVYQAFDLSPAGQVTPLGLRGGPSSPTGAECATWYTPHCPGIPADVRTPP